MENIENKIPNGENQDTQNSSFFSENVSSSNGLEPRLRFPSFDNKWTLTTIGNVCAFTNGKAHEQNVVEYGEYIIVNSKFISSDGVVKKYSNKQICPLFKNDIVMVMSDVPNGKAMSKCFCIDKDNKYTLNQRICALRTKQIPLYYMMQINRNDYFMKFDDGVKQTNLRKDDVLACPVYSTTIKEQTKIADFLSLIDQRIEKQRRLVESLKKYKRGALSRVFNDVLETVKLSDISNFISSARTLSTTLNGNKGIYPVYDAAGIAGYIDYYDIDSDYITIVKDGSGVGRLQKCDKKSSFIGTLGALVAKNCTTDFLYAVLQTIDFSKFVTGMAIPHIYYRDYKSTLLPFPSEEKQHFISQLLKKFDIYIENETQKLTNMLAYKQGLLQQMFI